MTVNKNSILYLAQVIQEMNERLKPHEIQAKIGHALFYEKCKNIFVNAARNVGKTEIACHLLWRYALENPGSENYILEPYVTQGREILWVSNRIQSAGHPRHIISVNNTEMRITLRNKSFIKVSGSDNHAALAGIKPKGLIVYDEIADHREDSIKNMEPNRAAHDSPALFIGSPPEFHCYFVELMELAQKSPHWRYFHAPTSANPHISKEWLARKKEEMIMQGDLEGYLRSYEGLYVKGGKRNIFPQYLKLELQPIDKILPKDINKWQMYIISDPATTSTFGVLFILFNPYTRKIKIIDEIYEQQMSSMTTREIWNQIDEIKAKYSGVTSFEYGYDEAAAWFMNETTEVRPDVWLTPSKKSEYGVGTSISLLRDAIHRDYVEVSTNCVKFDFEMRNYLKKDNGKIPKENDHLINCAQYFLHLINYSLDEQPSPKDPPKDEGQRVVSLEQDLAESVGFLAEIGDDLY
jgi:hypothetical protein